LRPPQNGISARVRVMSDNPKSANSKSWTGEEEKEENLPPLTREERRRIAQQEGRRIGRKLRPYVRPIILPFIFLFRLLKNPFFWFLVLIAFGAASASAFAVWTLSNCGEAVGQQPHIASEASSWGRKFLCEIRISDLVTIWLTWCLVVVGAFQAWWLFGTLAATQKAASAAHNDQRPWIEMIIMPISLTRDKKGVKLSLEIQVENVGHTPATAVFPYSELLLSVVGEKGNSQEDANKAFRKNFELATKMKFGNPLFPGRKKTFPISHRIEEKDLAPRLALDLPDGRYTFHLGAGVSYPFAGGMGETTALFLVWRKGEPVAFNSKDISLKADEIRFIEMPMWNTAK